MAKSYQSSQGVLEAILLQAIVSRNGQLIPSFPADSNSLVSAGATAWSGYSEKAYQKMIVGFFVAARKAANPSYDFNPGEPSGVNGDSHRISACVDGIVADIKAVNPAYDSSDEAMLANFGGMSHRELRGFILYCMSRYAQQAVGGVVPIETALGYGGSSTTKAYDSMTVAISGTGGSGLVPFTADNNTITADNNTITIDSLTI